MEKRNEPSIKCARRSEIGTRSVENWFRQGCRKVDRCRCGRPLLQQGLSPYGGLVIVIAGPSAFNWI